MPLTVLRLSVAVLIGAHPFSRIVLGNVPGFGEYLASRGFAFGVGVAWAVSLLEAAGVICLALNRCIRLAVPVHLVILITGIVMVHGPEGWFVVGGGRNGVEYSVLLIMCLVTLFLADRQSRQPLLERALVPR